MSDKVISSTTQEFLDVYDIVNDMVLLKDGTAAVILQVGTMNFSLLAEQEQDAVIFTYGSLLNSLNYPIQINIQSQTKDATKYLRLLDEQVTKASSDRKATLIKKYRDFVAALIKERNVLQKRFYIIVPASPGEMGLITPSSVLPGKTTFDISTVEKSILLEKALNILEPRKDHLTSQFNRLGLYVRQLSTQEIIQNFYINYNPEAAEGQEISSSENYTTPLVRASFGGKFMQTTNQPGTTPVNPTLSSAQISSSPTPEEIISGNPASTSTPPTPIVDTTPAADTQVMSDPVATVEQIVSPIVETNPIVETSPIIETVQEISTQDTPVINQVIPEQNQTISPSPIAPIGNIFPADQANMTAQSTQPSQPIQSTIGQEVPETAISDQSTELDLNLDAGLIDSNFSEPEPDFSQNFMGESVTEKAVVEELKKVEEVKEEIKEETKNAEPAISTEPASVMEPTAPVEPTQASTEPINDFAEDITPIQNKFDSQSKSTE